MKKHTMRLVSIVVIVVMLLGALTACGGGGISGKYYIDVNSLLSAMGMTAEELAEIGLSVDDIFGEISDFYMDFKSGGIVEGWADGEMDTAKYTVSGSTVTITSDGGEVTTFKIINSKTIEGDMEGMAVRFIKK